MSEKNFLNSKLYKALQFIGDLIALNFIFVITSIPIITIGASFTALYSAVGSDLSLKTYFDSYKKNFKQSTLVWLILMLLIDLATFNVWAVIKVRDSSFIYIEYVAVFLTIVISMTLYSWAFQLIALFDCKIKDVLKNSFVLGVGCLPVNAVLVLLNLIFPGMLMLFTNKFLQFGWIWLGIGFSSIAWLCSRLMKKEINKRIGIVFPEPQEEVTKIESSED